MPAWDVFFESVCLCLLVRGGGALFWTCLVDWDGVRDRRFGPFSGCGMWLGFSGWVLCARGTVSRALISSWDSRDCLTHVWSLSRGCGSFCRRVFLESAQTLILCVPASGVVCFLADASWKLFLSYFST